MLIDLWRWIDRYQAKLNDLGLFYLLLGMVMLLLSLGMTFGRADFLYHSTGVTGNVQDIFSDNDRCGSRRSKYDCTRYIMLVNYPVGNETYEFMHSAGDARGHNQSIRLADYEVMQPLKVLYNKELPSQVFLDDIWDVLEYPVLALVFGFTLCLKSSSEKIKA